MIIGIISDSHDNMPNIYKAIEFFKKEKINTVIHCGDVCAPSVMKEMAEKFSGEIHLCFGNVDGDRLKMEELAEKLPNMHIYGERGFLEIDGKKLAFSHYPEKAKIIAESGDYDCVFYGHDHKAWEAKVGNCFLRNPGTLAGLFAKPTFATYDTKTNEATLILVERLYERD